MDESTAIREERVKMCVARAEFHCQTRCCKSGIRRLHLSPGPHAKAVGFFLSDHLRNPYTHFLSKFRFCLSSRKHSTIVAAETGTRFVPLMICYNYDCRSKRITHHNAKVRSSGSANAGQEDDSANGIPTLRHRFSGQRGAAPRIVHKTAARRSAA